MVLQSFFYVWAVVAAATFAGFCPFHLVFLKANPGHPVISIKILTKLY